MEIANVPLNRKPAGKMENSFYNYSYMDDPIYEPNDTAMLIFSAIVTVLGLLGNGSLIFIIIRNRHMRNVPNLQILSLAAGDFLYLLLRIPVDVAYYAKIPWPFSEVYCKLTCSMVFVSQAVSVFTLTALSAERYYAIVKPMERRKVNVVRATVMMVVSIWTVSCIFSIPAFFMGTVDTYWNVCTMPILTRQYRIFIITMFVALYVVPLGMISVFYILTARKLLQGVGGRKMHLENKVGGNGAKNKSNARTRLAIIILIAVVLFALSWLPYYIYELWTELDPYLEYTNAILNFMYAHYLMPMFGSCINPVLLYIMSSNYRRHFAKHFCCCCSGPLDRDRTSASNRSWTLLSAFKSATVVSGNNHSVNGDIQMKRTSATFVSSQVC